LAVPAEPPGAGEGPLEALYREHWRAVFGAAYRVTGDAMDAEDVLQTVFLRIAHRAPALDGAPEAGPYLRRSAINAALDLLRSRARRADAPMPVGPGEPTVDSADEAVALRLWLRSALAALNPRAAEAFALHHFEGYRNDEIAAMLGTTPNAVGVTLHRARARLREALAAGA
jgi:RNA polymerase sigma-70 factor (ECF subfamily)